MIEHNAYLFRRFIFNFLKVTMGNPAQARSDTIAQAAIKLTDVHDVRDTLALTILRVSDPQNLRV